MAIDPEQFSELSNALQSALLLAGARTTAPQAEGADQLYRAISRAVTATRRLRVVTINADVTANNQPKETTTMTTMTKAQAAILSWRPATAPVRFMFPDNRPEFAPTSAGLLERAAVRLAWALTGRLMRSPSDRAGWWSQALINFATADDGDMPLLYDDLSLGWPERAAQRVAWEIVDVLAWLDPDSASPRLNWWTGAVLAFAETGDE